MSRPTIRLLCVDDDPLALDQLKAVIDALRPPAERSYFGSPKRAIEAHREAPFDVVLSDLKLGATTGLKMIEEMKSFAPAAIYMLLSGEADLDSALEAMNETHAFRFFTKPARAETLGPGLDDAIAEIALRRQNFISETAINAFAGMPTAVLSVDREGRVHYANDPARRILLEHRSFDHRDRTRLMPADPKAAARMVDFLNAAADRPGSPDQTAILRLDGRDDAPAVTLTAVAATGSDQGRLIHLILSDPARRTVAQPAQLGVALGLTPSEARVVHGLIETGSVEDAARGAGVSLSTARTYLKNVYHKTGVSKQAELVRLALFSAA